MIKEKWGPLRPMLLVFVVLNALFIVFRTRLDNWGADQPVLIIGNIILFLASFISYSLVKKSFTSPNNYAFVRAVYTSFIVKFFICALAAAAYALAVKQINKPALIGCLLIYIIYTSIEVSTLTKLLKKPKNA